MSSTLFMAVEIGQLKIRKSLSFSSTSSHSLFTLLAIRKDLKGRVLLAAQTPGITEHMSKTP